ncbi:electron transport complex subunit RsxB [Pseudocolwellia sp. AS88]|jgi:electron transport complex protein RnfB|uniref:electron transport complex subunit RsxB n=1 Tax=Pseudocolwellia sp. AS88 TaxID=3063958 RepID=UPI0026EED53E|nr:electron transport complex subunit RsxB [Pseudocolwellia sp. AS88]MDO7084690.1 electron transport complex subunit RsxB [Pseudocolwellia sp. AS88]
MSIIIAIIVIGIIALLFGALLGYASIRFKVEGDPLAQQIDDLLPQTQCGQCGYPGCKPYAEAVANGEAINKCAPGGEETIKKMAELLGVEVQPLDENHAADNTPKVAFIIEEDCIGCTKCIQACPVDAIIGTTKQMHTVIIDECTGCDLCVAPCPVDCIEMRPIETTKQSWQWDLNSIPVTQVD